MTTVSSTSASSSTSGSAVAAPAVTSTTTNPAAAATQQLLTSLGAGSGIDTSSLVTELVQAEFASKLANLTAQANTVSTQLSGLATLKSSISSFSSALDQLAGGGTLSTQPVSSDNSIVSAIVTPGAAALPTGLSDSITVNKLATAQTAQTTDRSVTDHTAKLFTGTLTITTGAATVNSDGTVSQSGGTAKQITLTNASIDDVAAAINASGAGLSASVVTDADGTAFLSMQGKTGAANGFTISSTTDSSSDHSLSMFNVGDGTGATAAGQAGDASLTVNGINVTRASNTVTDLVNGATLTFGKTGSVSLTASTPTSALTDAVNNFVSSYNTVLQTVTSATDPKTGPLTSDSAAQALLRGMQQLTQTVLLPNAAAGTPRTLAEIGVGTNRDGTLSVDTATLTKAITAHPDAVEAMFANPTTNLDGSESGDGLVIALDQLSGSALDPTTGLAASTTTYTAQQTRIQTEQSDITDQQATETTRLTQQFAAMNSIVSSYKSTQAFLTNQIAAWNKNS